MRQTISAVGVPAKIAKTLGVDAGYPALKIVRHYLDRWGTSLKPRYRFIRQTDIPVRLR
nr:UTRA domain-containing protein [Pectobacterium colocasium]